MNDRLSILRDLGEIEQELKELVILYEQYFAGVEKREPLKQRESLARRLRHFVNRRIIQTDARFRYQTLAARYHSYSSHWDRILRLIDEGRYTRHTANLKDTPPIADEPIATVAPVNPGDKIYQDLLAARQSCGITGPPPDPQQVKLFLENQRDKIREKFGDREVEFRVEIEDGKPKIKVRAKK